MDREGEEKQKRDGLIRLRAIWYVYVEFEEDRDKWTKVATSQHQTVE